MRISVTCSVLLRIVFFLIFNSLMVLNAQPGFRKATIVTNDNDTIHGMGFMSPTQKFCQFKPTGNGDRQTYKPYEINSFTYTSGNNMPGSYFVCRTLTDSAGSAEPIFLEYLVDGEIDVYKIGGSRRYFLQKEGDSIIELSDQSNGVVVIDGKSYASKNNLYLGYLRYYMQDAPQVYPEINNMTRITQAKLVDISVDYHNAVCTDYKCINYTKRVSASHNDSERARSNFTFKIEPNVGMNRHNDYYSANIGVNTWFGFTKGLYLKVGLVYKEMPYDWKDEPRLLRDPTKRENHRRTVDVPISMLYAFGKGKIKPTIALGQPAGFQLIGIQGGMLASLGKKIELNLFASADGLEFYLAEGGINFYFNNDFPWSAGMGLVININ